MTVGLCSNCGSGRFTVGISVGSVVGPVETVTVCRDCGTPTGTITVAPTEPPALAAQTTVTPAERAYKRAARWLALAAAFIMVTLGVLTGAAVGAFGGWWWLALIPTAISDACIILGTTAIWIAALQWAPPKTAARDAEGGPR